MRTAALLIKLGVAPCISDRTDRIIVADWSRGMILASDTEHLWFESEYDRIIVAGWSRGMAPASGAEGPWFNP